MYLLSVVILVATLLLVQLNATPFGFFFPQTEDNTNGNSSSSLNYTPIVNFLSAIRQENAEAATPFIARMRESFKFMAQGLANFGLQTILLANQVASNKLNHIAQVVSNFKSPTTTTTAAPSAAAPMNTTSNGNTTTTTTTTTTVKP